MNSNLPQTGNLNKQKICFFLYRVTNFASSSDLESLLSQRFFIESPDIVSTFNTYYVPGNTIINYDIKYY